MWGVKDFFQSFRSFEKNVFCCICVQNVFFSNGVFESHAEVFGGNFHLWKFKMRMMFSKHEL
jgi:hypothetical protein